MHKGLEIYPNEHGSMHLNIIYA